MATPNQRFVYVLTSTVHPSRYYTGLTSDVYARLAAHNAGLSKHTTTGRPWTLVTKIEFFDSTRAEAFERIGDPIPHDVSHRRQVDRW